MDRQEIKETPIWQLYEKGRNYHRLKCIYDDTDRNYRFYNGDQWEGAELGDVERVQKNFIKPIVKYKCAVIHDNLYAPVFSSLNFENEAFRPTAERYCELLNRYEAKAWERGKLDHKGRRITKDAAINGEGIIYVDFDEKTMLPVDEIIKKNDVYYGNENDDDIQSQPYILVRRRLPVVNAVDLALSLGMSEDKVPFIIGDKDTFEESGDAAKEELDDMVTVVYKFYKEEGTVRFSASTRLVEISGDNDLEIPLYPIAHFVWEEKEGSARGEGEVKNLIPNQIEVNRTEVRRVLTVKNQAFPHKVVDTSKVENPDDLGRFGMVIKTKGATVDDVRKIVGTIPPAQMSGDVKLLQDDLIEMSRTLAGAGDTATGDINAEDASGRAILAVQQASRAPVTEQKESYKSFVEDWSRIHLAYLIAHARNGVSLEEEYDDPRTGQKAVRLVRVPQSALIELQADVKIDVTPKSVYDKFAQERTLENMFVGGWFNVQKLPELEIYVEALDDDSVTPKAKLQKIVKRMKDTQRNIATMEANAQMMKQRVGQFLMGDIDGQASQIADAAMQLGAMQGGEAAFAAENPDDN